MSFESRQARPPVGGAPAPAVAPVADVACCIFPCCVCVLVVVRGRRRRENVVTKRKRREKEKKEKEMMNRGRRR